MRSTFTVMLAASAALSLGALCSSESKDDGAAGDDVPFEEQAKAAAAGALLTLGDFPAGWSSTPQEPGDDSLPDDLAVSPGCEMLLEENEFPGTLYEAESEEFDKDEDEDVSTTVGVYASTAAADLGQAAIEHVFANCVDEFMRLMEEWAAREDPAYQWEIQMEAIPWPSRGDWTNAQQLTMRVSGPDGHGEWVYRYVMIREGRLFGAFSFAESDLLSEDLVTSLVDLFAQRLARADAKLPS